MGYIMAGLPFSDMRSRARISGYMDQDTLVCRHFEPSIPGNSYCFCKYATMWIDGKRGKSSPYPVCTGQSGIVPVGFSVYCVRGKKDPHSFSPRCS